MHANGWKPIAGSNMLLKLFTTFLRIGLFTIGGGYVMIPMIQREVVERNGWISQEDFLDLLAISQAAPGIFAVNISIFIGYRMRKTTGSIVCATGTVIPSVAIILLIALFFQQVRDNPLIENIFKGIRPAVTALILVPTLKLAKAAQLNRFTIWVPALTAIAIWALGISPVIIIAATIAGAVLYYLKTKRSEI
ncbi:MAG: chromate transporter [Bacteroidaceae bacterium]|nr:chromate transporter [Bacteroidaceae bacterium]